MHRCAQMLHDIMEEVQRRSEASIPATWGEWEADQEEEEEECHLWALQNGDFLSPLPHLPHPPHLMKEVGKLEETEQESRMDLMGPDPTEAWIGK